MRSRLEWSTPGVVITGDGSAEHGVRSAGLRIVDIRACSFLANDPMGVDGPDHGIRNHFQVVRSGMKGILGSNLDSKSRQFFINFLAGTDRAALACCRQRLAEIDMPAQKLVLLAATP